MFWNLSLTAVVAMVVFIGKSLKQFQKIQGEYANMVEYESAYWSLLEKIDAASREKEVFTGTLEPRLTRSIRFDRVSFAYNNRPVLNQASLELPAGS